MFERIKTALVLVIVVFGCMFATLSPYPMQVLMVVVATLAGYEWYKLMPKSDIRQAPTWIPYAYAAVIFISSITMLYFHDLFLLLWLGSIFVAILSVFYVKNYPDQDSWYTQGLVLIGAVLITAAITAIFFVWSLSPWWLMYLFFLVWGADTGAYFVGRKFGRRPMLPNVSPKKTIEGLFGGLLTSALIIVIVQVAFLELNVLQSGLFLLLSMFTVLFSVLGDLIESMLKRRANVKDSGCILPGHGGVLDRIDSLLTAAPLFAAGVYLLKLIGIEL